MPIHISRSEVDSRVVCETLNFGTYHYAGKGLQKIKKALPLASGSALHTATALVLESAAVTDTVALDAAVQRGIDTYHDAILKAGISNLDPTLTAFTAGEQRALIEALVRGWRRYRLPDILAHYNVIEVEREHSVLLAHDVYQDVRLDAVLQPIGTNYLVIGDWKSTANESADWAEKLRRSNQTHMYVPAAEDIYGMYVAGVQYEGMFKGARRKGTGKWADRKLQGSPLIYGYKGPKSKDDPALAYQVEGTTRKGWEKFAVWEEPGMTVEKWLNEFVDPETLANTYQSVPPWRPQEQDMQDNRVLIAKREIEWRMKIEPGITLSLASPGDVPAWASKTLHKNRDACLKYGGDHRCALWDFCYDSTVAADPLNSGIYEPREPHHPDQEEED